MGWSNPRTWNVGEIVTKAIMDAHVRDNLLYLYTTLTTPERIVYLKVIADNVTLGTGDGQAYFTVPDILTGTNLVDADAIVYATSTSGLPTIQINNLDYSGGAQDMLTTPITIDVGELNSYTASAQPVISTTYDNVTTGDRLRVDVDVAGGGVTGLDVILTFQLP